jgi:hypothetical protein
LGLGRLPPLVGARPNPNATLLGYLGPSLMCLAAAFVVTAVLGVPLDLTSRAVREIIDPWIQLYKPVPWLAYGVNCAVARQRRSQSPESPELARMRSAPMSASLPLSLHQRT